MLYLPLSLSLSIYLYLSLSLSLSLIYWETESGKFSVSQGTLPYDPFTQTVKRSCLCFLFLFVKPGAGALSCLYNESVFKRINPVLCLLLLCPDMFGTMWC